MLLGRLSLGLCALWMACGQVPLRAQLFLVAQRSGDNQPGPGLVALAWNPSPDPNATGYFLGWGSASGACTNLLDAGNSTNATVAGLATNVTYYFSVVAYGTASQDSPPSNEIAYSLPSAAITLLVTNVLLSADSHCQALMPDLTGTNYTLVIDTCSDSVALTQSVAAGTVLAPGTNQVVLTLTDGCGNAAYATNSVIVQDTTPPVIQTLTQTGGILSLTWSAIASQKFQVQFKSNLHQTDWSDLSSAITATNGTMQAFDVVGPDAQRYYRIVRLP